MASELEKFELRQKKKPRAEEAAGIGAATALGLAGLEGTANELANQAENKNVRSTRAWEDFQAKLKPGDVLFHRRPIKNSAFLEAQGRKLPATEADMLMATKGDPYYHASVYMGGGKIGEAHSRDEGVLKNAPLYGEDTIESIKAYRPKVSEVQKKKALHFIRGSHGQEYKGFGGQLEHGLTHLFDPRGGPKTSCKPGEGGTVCSEVAANAYPKIFKDQYESPARMRRAENLDLVAHYNPLGKLSAREKLLTRGVYPVLHNLKYGIGAGALAYGGMSLADYLRKHGKSEDPA